MSAVASQPGHHSHVQLRRLYASLLEEQTRFDEFRQLLALYPAAEHDEESTEGEQVRARLNARISEWLCGHFDGLSTAQVALWRSIVVEGRLNTTGSFRD